MAKRGRPKKPDALRILDGSHLERMHGDAPTSPLGVGEPPDWLDEFAREAWTRLVDRVGEMRLLTRADHDAVLIYALAYSDMRHAMKEIEGDRTVNGGQDGEGPLKAHPLWVVKNNAVRTMLAIMGQLGMTPSARASLHVDSPTEGDPLMDYLNGRTTGQKPRTANGPQLG